MAESNAPDPLLREQQEAMRSTLHEIMPKLWLGGHRAAENVEGLLRRNISFVLTLKTGSCPSSVRRGYEQHHIENLRFNIEDSSGQDILSILRETCDKIEEKLQAGEGVLVHCAMGMSRSATIVTAYVIQRWGIGRDQALEYVRSKRNVVHPNRGFLSQLKTWERNLRSPVANVRDTPKRVADEHKTAIEPSVGSLSDMDISADSQDSSSTAASPIGPNEANGVAKNPEREELDVYNTSASSGTIADLGNLDKTLLESIGTGLEAVIASASTSKIRSTAASMTEAPVTEPPMTAASVIETAPTGATPTETSTAEGTTSQTLTEVFYQWRSQQEPWKKGR